MSHGSAFVSPPSLSGRDHIQHAIWLYLRFTLSYRDVEELLAERGLDVSCETVRRRVLKFGPLIARTGAGNNGTFVRTENTNHRRAAL